MIPCRHFARQNDGRTAPRQSEAPSAPEFRPESPAAGATPDRGLARGGASVLCPVQRVNVQKSLRLPNLLLARLLRGDAVVAGPAVDRHLVAITADDDPDELFGHVAIAVNEPAGVPPFPRSRGVYAEASNLRCARDVDAKRAKRSLCLEEPAAAISPPGLATIAEQSRDRMNVQAADWDESRP